MSIKKEFYRIIPKKPFTDRSHNYEKLKLERRYSYIEVSGKNFSPALIEKIIKLPLYDKLEPGEPCLYLSKNHPWYGKPSKTGDAILQPPSSIANQIGWTIKKLKEFGKVFRENGADKIILWEVAFFLPDAQKNFELNPDEMKILHKENVPYCLSIYDIDIQNVTPLSKKYSTDRYRNVKFINPKRFYKYYQPEKK